MPRILQYGTYYVAFSKRDERVDYDHVSVRAVLSLIPVRYRLYSTMTERQILIARAPL